MLIVVSNWQINEEIWEQVTWKKIMQIAKKIPLKNVKCKVNYAM